MKPIVRATNEKHGSDKESPLQVVSEDPAVSSEVSNFSVDSITTPSQALPLETLQSAGDSISEMQPGNAGWNHPGLEDGHKVSWSLVSSDQPLPHDHPCKNFTLPPPPADKKRTGPRPCPVCYLPVQKAIEEMPTLNFSRSAIIKNLSYVVELPTSQPIKGFSGSEFGGHPSLEDRKTSFQIQEYMNVHCGFVKGSQPGAGTGFDISEDDRMDMDRCSGIVVASAIFGNYDKLQQPKNISPESRQSVCFFMFVDEETRQHMGGVSTGKKLMKNGLWRVVLVHNLPYTDARRNGKIPKLLLHRLFPNARFSLWIDGKLELIVDPYQILERFLWRGNHVFAISQHYKRLDVFEEAQANKAAGKYDNASIDAQVNFYQKGGLKPYNKVKSPFPSDVPEGCVIIREHTQITNLFTCLWFNEVDRFTSRDQLSFAVVRDKLMEMVPWRLSMFLDCERRNFVVQAYHRELLELKKGAQNTSLELSNEINISDVDQAAVLPPPSSLGTNIEHVRPRPTALSRKASGKRRRGASIRQRVRRTTGSRNR